MVKKITINPKNILKRFIFFNIRAVIAYHITLFLLGYSSFKPLVIRGFNVLTNPETFPSYVAESDTLFLICAPKESLMGTVTSILGGTTTSSGFTLAQMAVCGLTMASVMFGLHLAQEYVVPPIMRGIGWTSWKTARELALENSENIQNLADIADNLDVGVTNVEAGVNTLQKSVQRRTDAIAENLEINTIALEDKVEAAVKRIKRDVRAEIDTVVVFQTSLNEKLVDLGANVNNLMESSVVMASLAERINTLAVDTTTSIKDELTMVFDKYNNEHAEVQRTLQQTLVDLQQQASSLETYNPEGILSGSAERINDAIKLLETAIHQHATNGSKLQETVKPQLIQLGEVQDKVTGAMKPYMVMKPRTSAQSAPSSKPVLEGLNEHRMKRDVVESMQETLRGDQAKMTTLSRQSHQLTTTTRSAPETIMAEGVNFNIAQEGDEIIIRLRIPEGTKLQNLSDISTMPVSLKKPSGFGPLLSPETTTDLTNRMTNFVWDQATTRGFQLALGVGTAALSGGVPNVIKYMGGGSLTASVLNAVTAVPAKSPQTSMFENFVGTVEKGLTVYKAINNK